MPPEDTPKLGILAGGGALPRRLIDACRDQGRDFLVLAFEDHAEPETVEGIPHLWTRFGTVASALEELRDQGVGEVVLAGRVARPSLTSIKPDKPTSKILARVLKKALGDDTLLTALIGELEDMGFTVVGVDSVLKELLAGEGALGAHIPDDQAKADIERALAVARALGEADVGQAVVVQQGMVLGVEAIEGTDALLERCGRLKRDGPGGVLVKMRKPHQDRRFSAGISQPKGY